ncbi:MAG: hypothetical protein IPO88_08145 [Nannocystis sp.]|uniref:ADYC domain-containing protein n=1 Tax=Nannocystis sp. TaxID=1962667 RepID=UPI00242A120E|nr:ADYC domain-containing protein [Nannocystis sp.]MBK9753462.1 hypothetical protein [Nannocystis sp.]
MPCRFRPATITLALTAALTAACDGSIPDDPGELEFRDSAGQGGPVFNTPKIFTSEVAAVDTQGQALAGVVLVDVKIDEGGGQYTSIDAGSLDVDHGTLMALVGGSLIEGGAFIGSQWTFDVKGDSVTAQLTTVVTSDVAGLWDPGSINELRKLDPERLVYTFEWFDGDVWHTTCEEDAVGGAWTVLFGDIVVNHKLGNISARPNTVYFGCISGAVGKAALWGYAPDSPSEASVPLPAFTTATRMVRADYCADGVPHTNVGNPVAMRDRWAINDFDAAPVIFTTEAVWQVGGRAKCLRKMRDTGALLIVDHVCANGQVIPRCSSDAVIENRWTTLSYGDLWTKTP